MQVQALLSKPLTERDKAVIRRHAIIELKEVEAWITDIAGRVFNERIRERYADDEEVRVHSSTRPKW